MKTKWRVFCIDNCLFYSKLKTIQKFKKKRSWGMLFSVLSRFFTCLELKMTIFKKGGWASLSTSQSKVTKSWNLVSYKTSATSWYCACIINGHFYSINFLANSAEQSEFVDKIEVNQTANGGIRLKWWRL